MRTLTLLAATAAVFVSPVFGQILPGHSIAAVNTLAATNAGAMYDIDHQAGTATALTISATLIAQVPNCVLMTSGVTGYVGTNVTVPTTVLPGNVYSILVVGGVVTETLLNTTPTAGQNVAELAIVGTDIYFTTQNGALGPGILQRVPITGGPVTTVVDLATLGAVSLANAVCAIGTKVYVATFNATTTATTPCEVFEWNTLTNTGRLVLNLPPGGFIPTPPAWNAGIVNMEEDPLRPGILALAGVYGDLIYVDPVANTVVNSFWTGTLNGTALGSGTINSFTWDPVARDWIIGTRSGSIERWVGAQQADNQITGVGSATASLTGIHHIPNTAGIDYSYGAGCVGNGSTTPGSTGWTPTDSSYGAPTGGNSSFRLAVHSCNGGDAVILAMDFQNVAVGPYLLPYDMASFGAPGCFARSGLASTQLFVTSGAGVGGGHAIRPLPIPVIVLGMTVYRQWFELQATPTNALGIVVSNARRLVVQ